MVQRPCPDLRGACAAMSIPTATGGRGAAMPPPTRLPGPESVSVRSGRDAAGLSSDSMPQPNTVYIDQCFAIFGDSGRMFRRFQGMTTILTSATRSLRPAPNFAQPVLRSAPSRPNRTLTPVVSVRSGRDAAGLSSDSMPQPNTVYIDQCFAIFGDSGRMFRRFQGMTTILTSATRSLRPAPNFAQPVLRSAPSRP